MNRLNLQTVQRKDFKQRQGVLWRGIVLAISLLVLLTGVVWAMEELLWQDQVDFAGYSDIGDFVIADGPYVFAAGRFTDSANNTDWMVRAYDAESGTLLWEDQFDLSAEYDTIFNFKLYNHKLYVVGNGEIGGGNYHAVMRVYDAPTGTLMWHEQFNHSGGYDFYADVVVMQNQVIVTGGMDRHPLNFDWMVRAFDVRDGTLLWEDYLDFAGEDGDVPWQMAKDRSRVFIAGNVVTTTGDSDALVRAYHARTGALLWQYQFDHEGMNNQSFLIEADGRHVYVGGWIGRDTSDNVDWIVWALDANDGRLLWQDHFDPHGGFDGLLDIAYQDSRLFSAGSITTVSGGRDILVRSHDALTGAVLWEHQFDLADGFDSASSIDVNGRHLVAFGSGTNANGGSDWIILDIDTTNGSLLWQNQFDLAGGTELAFDVSVSRDRAYVIGGGVNANNNLDWLLQAYNLR